MVLPLTLVIPHRAILPACANLGPARHIAAALRRCANCWTRLRSFESTMKSITSAANANFRRWLRLATQPRAVREEKQTLAEGMHLAQAALAPAAAGATVSAVIVRAAARGGADGTIAPLVHRALQSGAAGFE